MFDRLSDYFSQIVGFIIGLMIIGFTFTIYNAVKPVYDMVYEQNMQSAIMAQEARFSAYNNHIVSGSQLITAMKRYSDQDNFYVYVKRNSPTTNFIGNPTDGPTTCLDIDFNTGSLMSTTTGGCNVTVGAMSDESSSYFIPPQTRFVATILRDGNDRIAGILFSTM